MLTEMRWEYTPEGKDCLWNARANLLAVVLFGLETSRDLLRGLTLSALFAGGATLLACVCAAWMYALARQNRRMLIVDKKEP